MRLRSTVLLLALALASACASSADRVCQDVGYCTTQSDAQVQACKDQAQQLGDESSASGCSSQYSAYYSCADNAYTCNGNVPTFPECDSDRAALDTCLEQGRAKNSCGALEKALATCPTTGTPPPILPAPCRAAEVCASSCYLAAVPDVCRPQPLQLTEFTACAERCPP